MRHNALIVKGSTNLFSVVYSKLSVATNELFARDHMSESQNRNFLSTQEAHDKTGLSVRYLQQLLQQERLEGFKASSIWFVYTDSLTSFMAQPRKRGPKGPHKKKLTTDSQNALSKTEQIGSTDNEQQGQEAEEPQRT